LSRTHNLAIAFFEVVGYAEATSRWTREEAERALAIHRDLLRPAIDAFGGQLVKVSGGSHLIRFDSPTNAALCAAAVHDRAAALRKRASGETVEFRVGISMGEVRVENRDVFGDAVNIAARLVAEAAAGEILLAEVVYLAMNKAEVPSEEVGERVLKGIPEKIRIYRVPRGVYRLSSVGEAPPGATELPYGGLGLAHAPNLPPVDPAKPGSASTSFPSIAAVQPLASAAASLASRLANAVFGNRVIAIVGSVVLIVGVTVGFALRHPADPIERMIEQGDAAGAKAAIDLLPKDARRTYLEGRLYEPSHPARAAIRYIDAARQGDRRAVKRLIGLLGNSDCDARENAARGLGHLKEKSAKEALQRLAGSEDQGIRAGIFSFGCNPASAAREALKDLESSPDAN
jgi:adenylate cyclase